MLNCKEGCMTEEYLGKFKPTSEVNNAVIKQPVWVTDALK